MAQIQIVPPRLAHAAALCELYRSATADAPHCRFVPDAERFGACLLSPPPARTQIVVAEEHGAPKGFAALGQIRNDAANTEEDAITALFFEHEAVGQALLEACEARVGSSDLLAFPAAHEHCPITGYNGGWDGLSDRIPAVAQLLARNGYAPYYRELQLVCDLTRRVPEQGDEPAGVSLRESVGEHGEFVLHALLEGHEAGVCHYKPMTSLQSEAAARTGYVLWLHVEPDARRRGIGRHLMLRTLDHLRGLGCEACWLTTGADNWPAQPLYLARGFEIVDCSASYRKTGRGAHGAA
jgi:ribosomal protein S18 acetylase RimI-like enzyme